MGGHWQQRFEAKFENFFEIFSQLFPANVNEDSSFEEKGKSSLELAPLTSRGDTHSSEPLNPRNRLNASVYLALFLSSQYWPISEFLQRVNSHIIISSDRSSLSVTLPINPLFTFSLSPTPTQPSHPTHKIHEIQRNPRPWIVLFFRFIYFELFDLLTTSLKVKVLCVKVLLDLVEKSSFNGIRVKIFSLLTGASILWSREANNGRWNSAQPRSLRSLD